MEGDIEKKGREGGGGFGWGRTEETAKTIGKRGKGTEKMREREREWRFGSGYNGYCATLHPEEPSHLEIKPTPLLSPPSSLSLSSLLPPPTSLLLFNT